MQRSEGSENDRCHVVLLQVEGHALHFNVKAHQLTGLHTAQAVHLLGGVQGVRIKKQHVLLTNC